MPDADRLSQRRPTGAGRRRAARRDEDPRPVRIGAGNLLRRVKGIDVAAAEDDADATARRGVPPAREGARATALLGSMIFSRCRQNATPPRFLPRSRWSYRKRTGASRQDCARPQSACAAVGNRRRRLVSTWTVPLRHDRLASSAMAGSLRPRGSRAAGQPASALPLISPPRHRHKSAPAPPAHAHAAVPCPAIIRSSSWDGRASTLRRGRAARRLSLVGPPGRDNAPHTRRKRLALHGKGVVGHDNHRPARREAARRAPHLRVIALGG